MKNNKNWIQFNISPLEVSIKNIKIMGFVQYFTTRGLNKEQKKFVPSDPPFKDHYHLSDQR